MASLVFPSKICTPDTGPALFKNALISLSSTPTKYKNEIKLKAQQSKAFDGMFKRGHSYLSEYWTDKLYFQLGKILACQDFWIL